LDSYQAEVINNDELFESNSDLITSAFEVVSAYESAYRPLWLNDATRNVNIPREQSGGLELEMAMIAVMQGIIDHAYLPENISRFRNILEHKMFETSEYFPGKCDPPADPSISYEVKINASQSAPWGVLVMFDDKPARRPTGCYAAPGSFVTVTVPPSMVNKDYSVRVGAHSWDLSNKPRYERLDRISLLYPITNTETVVANPLGGGVYIEVPVAADAGIVTITITGAVRSPFYSDKPWHKTTLSEWMNTERHHPGPWTDFESEKYMMQVPTNWIYNYDSPDVTMANWNKAMDYVSDLTGKPHVRNGQTVLYHQVDVIIRGSAYYPGYPMSNDPYNPLNDENGNKAHYFLTGPGKGNSTTFHELGHAEHITKFPGETEAVVNLLYVAVMNQGFGYPLDLAFSLSMGNKETISKDQAAIMWMVTRNFRQGNPMDITNSTKNEVRYQHRGYGKYVEVADLFGWEALNNFWYSVNADYMNGITYNRNNDEADNRILRMSRAAGVDLRPLVQFWGVHPNNDDTLKLAVQSEGLMPSALIYDQLMHYKTLIPMNNAEFNEHADIVYPERDGTGNVDYGKGWYGVWDDQYNESHGDSAQIAIQEIIDYYFPAGRPNTETYALTVNNGGGSGNYYAGQNVSIWADDPPAGQSFSKWIASGGAVVANVNSANTTLTMPANNAEVTATYEEITDTEEILNLVLPANGGNLESFTSEYGSGWVASDLTNGVTNEDGWSSAANPGPQEFVYSFLDDLSAVLNEAVIHAGTAEGSYFSKDVEVWTSADGINFTKAAGGTLQNAANTSITLNLGRVQASKVKLVITSGYRTDYWELGEFEVMGALGSAQSSDYTLTVNNGSGDGTYEPGAVVAITADPPPSGQEFFRWVVNSGSPVIANPDASATTLTMGYSNATITAQYKNQNNSNAVKVFILAGQSNMVGTGTVTMTSAHIERNGGKGTLEYLVNDPAQEPTYNHLVNADKTWVERDDVWIVDLIRSGPLSVGYGVNEDHIGPEMQFGHVVGDYFDSKVLLIKTSWGGKSLYEDFRPPSSGGELGPYYTMMIDRVHEVLNNIEGFMPGYSGEGYEIAGFGWHQGWNDRISDAANEEYQTNCVNLINDLRDEFGLPDMPFVLATTGMTGWEETNTRALSLMEAQLAVPYDIRLNFGNVVAVETRDFWRDAEDSPADQGYHWNRNAETYFLIGNGMGEAMVQLLLQGDTTDSDDLEYLPEEYALKQNYPNPFNPSTTISYNIPEQTHVSIKVYDILGGLVATLVDEIKSEGNYTVTFSATSEDGSGLPTGMYILLMHAGNYTGLKKMMLIK
jgi:hypothetical protein